MKFEDFEEINENDNHENKKRFFVHKPTKSLGNLNENIFKNILNEIDSDTTDELFELKVIKNTIKIMNLNIIIINYLIMKSVLFFRCLNFII